MIPGFITIGSVSGSWGVAGGSDFMCTGGISFHNSPDVMYVRYKFANVRTSNQIHQDEIRVFHTVNFRAQRHPLSFSVGHAASVKVRGVSP